jgi:hypothetical protein
MRLILRGMICAVALLGSLQFASAQQYHRLTLADFEARPQRGGDAVAYTHCSIGFQYTAEAKDGYYLLNVYVSLEINRDQSWIDRKRISSDMMTYVMNHEQGHYTIAYLEQQEILRTVSKTRFGSDYKIRAQEIFDRIHEKYEQLTKDYDDDTNHSQNHTQQNSWDEFFRRKVEYLPQS